MFDWPYWITIAELGQSDRTLVAKRLLYRYSPDLFEVLDFDNEAAFLEPLLVAAALEPDPATSLAQVLVGYLREQHIATNSGGDPIDFVANVNEDGFAVLPRLGYIDARSEKGQISLRYDPHVRELFHLSESGKELVNCVETPVVRGGRFPVLVQKHPLLDRHIVDVHGGGEAPQQLSANKEWVDTLDEAITTIEFVFPEFAELLNQTTKGFALFSQPDLNSFAAESLHGLSFLSVPPIPSLPYFIEDVLHQCGHIMFGSMAFNIEEFLSESKTTPISKYDGNTGDSRSIFVICHAVFTEYVTALGLLRCLERGGLSSAHTYEASGRLAFVLRRYKIDIGNLFVIPTLVDRGAYFRQQMYGDLPDITQRARPFVEGAGIGGQGYNFDVKTSCARAVRGEPSRRGLVDRRKHDRRVGPRRAAHGVTAPQR